MVIKIILEIVVVVFVVVSQSPNSRDYQVRRPMFTVGVSIVTRVISGDHLAATTAVSADTACVALTTIATSTAPALPTPTHVGTSWSPFAAH